ncbi:hypothetical protein Csa_015475, partial [Cucumis sativus]
ILMHFQVVTHMLTRSYNYLFSTLILKNRLCERHQAIRKLERKIEDKDRELQSIKLDNDA